jgi:exopolyphosphatase / guanosine-5'-triphosphate,3'-diphosphate pyrophosphatase
LSDYKAVIDIGTNSFHLIIAKVLENGRVNTIHREKVVMRLGSEHKDVMKYITPDETSRAVELLKEFKKLSEFYKADLYAVATSAVRESQNRDEFTGTVLKETGIKIKVIDGREEASYIYTGVINALPVTDKRTLCVDIGGGSTELIIGRNGKSDFIQSHKLGAVRLSRMFFEGYIITPTGIKNCTEYILNTLKESGLPDTAGGFDIAVGASGTIIAIASVTAVNKYGKVPEDLNGFAFTEEELNSAAEDILSKATWEERTLVKGIDKSRAEIIPAGVLILQNLFSILNIREMTISGYALREGILLSLVKK